MIPARVGRKLLVLTVLLGATLLVAHSWPWGSERHAGYGHAWLALRAAAVVPEGSRDYQAGSIAGTEALIRELALAADPELRLAAIGAGISVAHHLDDAQAAHRWSQELRRIEGAERDARALRFKAIALEVLAADPGLSSDLRERTRAAAEAANPTAEGAKWVIRGGRGEPAVRVVEESIQRAAAARPADVAREFAHGYVDVLDRSRLVLNATAK